MLIRDILDHAVKLYSTKTALIDGEVELTYAQAHERVHRLASGLLSLGLKPGDQIAILANNSHRYWETYFVADIAGMPLAPLNIRLAAKELEFILNDSDVKAILVGAEYLELYQQFHEKTTKIEHAIVLDDVHIDGMTHYEELIASSEPLATSARTWDENEMLNLCYTGGTTGLPKGVMLSQRNVVSNAQHIVMTHGFREQDVWLHAAPMFHLADAWACYSVTMVGGTHVFLSQFTPKRTLEAIQTHRVTKTILVPTMINFLTNFPDVGSYDTSSLDMILLGGAPMPVDRLQAAAKVFGPVLLQAYGLTETAPILTAMQRGWVTYDGSETDTARLASCGRQVAGVTVRIVNEETGEDVKPGEVGSLIASGPNVMLGYWNREDETKATLRDGFIYTGDLATIDEQNFVYIVDRAKDMIVTGGENVYCAAVENAIYEHPGVLEAAVIGVPDEKWGEAVLAIIVPREGHEPTEQDIIDHCRTRIAGYKLPKRVVFQAEPLPKSGPGKILKTELRKPYWAGKDKQVN